MRVGFMGKGGSGKTTIAAGFTQHLANSNRPVLAVDGDLNVHFGSTLGMETKHLHRMTEEIGKWLEPSLSEKSPIIGTTPPSADTRFIRVDNNDPFLNKYATRDKTGNISLLTVGTYEPDNAGSHCYHVKLEVAEIILHRIIDTASQWVVSDSTAGIDSIGTSLYFANDANVFVVEPTRKSVSVYKDFSETSKQHGLKTYVIANKITDDADLAFINSEIESDAIIGTVGLSPALRKMEQGDDTAFADFVAENETMWKAIEAITPVQNRDWAAYQQQLNKVFLDNCKWWYDGYYQQSLADHIDLNFDLQAKVDSELAAS